jgi:hypothetical protein
VFSLLLITCLVLISVHILLANLGCADEDVAAARG